MSYQTIPSKTIAEVTKSKIQNEDIRHFFQTQQPDKDEIDLNEIKLLSEVIKKNVQDFDPSGTKSSEARDEFEAEIAQSLHEVLKKIDVEILDDPGFWAYLTFHFFWDWVYWSQKPTFNAFMEKGTDDYRNYVSGTDSSRCVVLRTFLRGKLTYEATGSYELSKWSDLGRSGGSFWTDEVLARSNWHLPKMLSKVLEKFATDDDFKVGKGKPIRRFSLMLGRRRASLLLHSLTDKETEELFNELLEEN